MSESDRSRAGAAPARGELLILAALLLAGLVLRVIGLNAPLWYDEILTLTRHVRLSLPEMLSIYDMNFHVLYSVLAKPFVALFGEQAWALRMPAMLFGVGSIAAMWWLARRIAGPFPALVTAALLAASYHHIWFSQNARGYTELMFFGVAGTILFLRALRQDGPAWGLWIAYGLVSAAAAFTHLTGVFLVLTHFLVWAGLLAWHHGAGKPLPEDVPGVRTLSVNAVLPVLAGFALGGLVTIALYAPALPYMLSEISGVADGSAVDEMQEYQNPLWALAEVVRTLAGPAGIMAVLGLGALGLTAIGTAATWRRAPIFCLVVLGHVALTLLLLNLFSMRIWPRFFFADIGFIMLLIVQGVFFVCAFAAERARAWFSWSIGAGVLKGLATAAMIALSLMLAWRNYQLPKQNLQAAYELVEEARAPGDAVFTMGVVFAPFEEFYEVDWGRLETPAMLEAALSAPGDIYVVLAFPARTHRSHAAVLEAMEGRVGLVETFYGTLGDGAVEVYRSR